MQQAVRDTDKFGNRYAQGLPYARGRILTSTEDDYTKVQRAWRVIEKRGLDRVFIFSGLEHGLPIAPAELPFATDELAPALYLGRLKRKALEHLGGNEPQHDVAVFNRLTGATIATTQVLVKPGDVVIGVSASHSHASVARAVKLAGARLIDTVSVQEFERELDRHERVALVVATRLAVTYEMLALRDVEHIAELCAARKILIYVDDAGGARVGPAIFDQPKMLELGVDLVATGLDKYGTIGPRLGLMAGRADLVGKIRARGFELGVECRPMLYPAVLRTLEEYTPERVRELVACTKEVAAELRKHFGDLIHETEVIAEIPGEGLLELAMRRAGVNQPAIVPFEAVAAFCMILLEDHGIMTVHYVAVPPGTGDVLIKFIPPETLAAFGGVKKFGDAFAASLERLATMVAQPERIRALLLGPV